MKSAVYMKRILGVGYLGLINLKEKNSINLNWSFLLSQTYTAVSPFKLWFNNIKIIASYTSLQDYSSFWLLFSSMLPFVYSCAVKSSSLNQNLTILGLFFVYDTSWQFKMLPSYAGLNGGRNIEHGKVQ